MVTTVIAGCSRGLGRDLFEYYSSQGIEVIGCARSSVSDLSRVYQCDLANEQEVKLFFSEILKFVSEFRLIITAGVNIGTQPIAVESPGVINDSFQGNFLAPVNALKVAQKYAFLGKCKSVIFMSSLAVTANINGSGIYSACKAGVEKLLSVCVRETKELDCNFNVIRLGYYESESAINFGEKWLECIYKNQLNSRPLKLDEVVAVVDFLSLSPASKVVNGQVIKLCH